MPSLTPNLAMRGHLDSQIAVMAELTRKSFDSTRRLTELNLELTRGLFEDFFSLSRQMLASGDPVQAAALMTQQIQPVGERLRSYAQQLSGLLSGAQVDLTRATENFMPELTRAAQAFTANAATSGPGGMFGTRQRGNGPA